MSNLVNWKHSKHVPDSINTGMGDLVAITFGKTKEIKEARAKQISLLPNLLIATEQLLEQIAMADQSAHLAWGEAIEKLQAVLTEIQSE